MTKQQIKKACEKSTAAQMEMEKAYKHYYNGMITMYELNSTIAMIMSNYKKEQNVVNAILHVIQYGINTSNIFRIAEIFQQETSDYIKLEIEKDMQYELYAIQQEIQSA